MGLRAGLRVIRAAVPVLAAAVVHGCVGGQPASAPPTATAVVASPTASPAPSCPGLVSFWQAEGNADDAIGSNDGELVGGAKFAPGQVGQAFSFDGTDDLVRVPNAPALNPEGSFTFVAWIRPDREGGGIIEKWGDAGDHAGQRAYDLSIQAGASLRFAISGAPEQNLGAFHRFDTPAGAIELGDWSHVAWVYDQPAGLRSIYVDGVLAAERTDAPTTVMASTADLGFGAIQRSSTESVGFYKGLIDEVQLFDTALAAADVAAAFAAGAAGTCR